MRRLSLSTKLFAAALPLVIAVGGLLALTVRSDLDEIDRAESGSQLGGVWEPLIVAMNAVEAEGATIVDSDADAVIAGSDAGLLVADPEARRATDQAINDVRDSIDDLGAAEAAGAHVTAARSALSAARRNVDMAQFDPDMVGDIDPIEAYGIASRELVAIGQLLPSEAGDETLGRQLLAVVKLAEAKLHANDVIAGTSAWPNERSDSTPLVQARDSFANLVTTFGEFEAIAPGEWGTTFRQSGFNTTLGTFNTSLTNVARAADADRVETFDTPAFTTFIDQVVDFERTISASIVEEATTQADATRTATLRRIGIILTIVLLATVIAWVITRSITRRVKAVADSANRVASDQLPALVEALRDPRGKAVLPDIEPVDARGGDDLADLARAFNSMQETLIDVAHEQVEVLRRGVSDIFITMARRNRSLIDRQLSMLDEFEAGVDDHEVLANYYQLDHLATRMRRNSESLLVLANAEPKRRRVKATEIDDVVRASIGEVEDYRRIEIQALESLQVKGNVVADVSHLLAELLDNATSFSPPGSAVRVGGRRADNSYLLRIVDDGVGIGPERLAELNELLREPPIVGLSVESTLGISVVSLLANKHDIDVTLSAGSPGLTVDVILPSSLYGPMDAPAEQPTAQQPTADTTPAAAAAAANSAEAIVSWNDQPATTMSGAPMLVDDTAGDVESSPLVAPMLAADPAGRADHHDHANHDGGLRLPTGEAPIDSAAPTLDGDAGPTDIPAEPTIAISQLSTDIPAETAAPTLDADTGPSEPPITVPQLSTDIPVEAAAPTLDADTDPADTPTEPTITVPQLSTDDDSYERIVRDVPAATGDETVAPTLDADTDPADTPTEPTTAVPQLSTDDDSYTRIVRDVPAATDGETVDEAEAEAGTEWTTMSLDMSAFETAAAEPDPDPIETATAPTGSTATDDNEVAAAVEPEVEPSTEPEPETAATIDLPPPAPARPEFAVPPAPPITAGGISQRPVTPDTARPAPVPTPSADMTPSLPTRTQRGTGPEGPDRMATPAMADGETPVTTSEPGALQAALAAYDSGRAAVNAPVAGALPTRDRGTESVLSFDEPQAVTQSRVDPAALRDRLRAFQSEFSSAASEPAGGTDIYTDHHDHPDQRHGADHDSGGDPR